LDYISQKGHAQISLPLSRFCDDDLIDPLHLENNAVGTEFKNLASEFYSRGLIQKLFQKLKEMRLNSVSSALAAYLSQFNSSKDSFSFSPRLLGPQVMQIYQFSNELCDSV